MSRYPLRLAIGLLLAAVLVLPLGCASRVPKDATKLEATVMTTGYCKCKRCCGWKRTWYGKPVFASGKLRGKRKKIGVTASGTKAKPGTIAADPSVYPFGTVMYVPGYGWGRVEDVGGAIKGQHIDLYFKSHQQALEWGRQHRHVEVYIPR